MVSQCTAAAAGANSSSSSSSGGIRTSSRIDPPCSGRGRQFARPSCLCPCSAAGELRCQPILLSWQQCVFKLGTAGQCMPSGHLLVTLLARDTRSAEPESSISPCRVEFSTSCNRLPLAVEANICQWTASVLVQQTPGDCVATVLHVRKDRQQIRMSGSATPRMLQTICAAPHDISNTQLHF